MTQIDDIHYQVKTPVSGMDYIFWSYWTKAYQILQDNDNGIGYLPQPGSETLLLKIPHMHGSNLEKLSWYPSRSFTPID